MDGRREVLGRGGGCWHSGAQLWPTPTCNRPAVAIEGAQCALLCPIPLPHSGLTVR